LPQVINSEKCVKCGTWVEFCSTYAIIKVSGKIMEKQVQVMKE